MIYEELHHRASGSYSVHNGPFHRYAVLRTALLLTGYRTVHAYSCMHFRCPVLNGGCDHLPIGSHAATVLSGTLLRM